MNYLLINIIQNNTLLFIMSQEHKFIFVVVLVIIMCWLLIGWDFGGNDILDYLRTVI